jgi:hypothetical protein
VGFGYGTQLLLGFGKGYVQHGLSLSRAFEQKLHRQGGLTRPRYAFHQVRSMRIEPAGEDVVEAFDACPVLDYRGRFGRMRRLIH